MYCSSWSINRLCNCHVIGILLAALNFNIFVFVRCNGFGADTERTLKYASLFHLAFEIYPPHDQVKHLHAYFPYRLQIIQLFFTFSGRALSDVGQLMVPFIAKHLFIDVLWLRFLCTWCLSTKYFSHYISFCVTNCSTLILSSTVYLDFSYDKWDIKFLCRSWQVGSSRFYSLFDSFQIQMNTY